MLNMRFIVTYIALFTVAFALCYCWSIRTYEFAKHTGVGSSDLNPLLCARAAHMCQSCGCKMNVYDQTYDVLRKADWYENPLFDPTFKYMETDTVGYVKPNMKLIIGTTRFLFHTAIPVCMDPQYAVELNFTLKNGWTRMVMHLKNQEGHFPFIIVLDSDNSTDHIKVRTNPNTVDDIVAGFHFLSGRNYVLKVKLLETVFKIFVNDDLLHEFNPNTINTTPDQITVSFFDVVSDLHYVKFRKTVY